MSFFSIRGTIRSKRALWVPQYYHLKLSLDQLHDRCWIYPANAIPEQMHESYFSQDRIILYTTRQGSTSLVDKFEVKIYICQKCHH